VERLEVEEHIEWLAARSERADIGRGSGFDAVGWADSVWILHAMYETSNLPAGLSHDDARHIELDAGASEAVVVGEVDVSRMPGLSLIGCAMGRSADPGEGWSRLAWGDLANRLECDPFRDGLGPCFKSFPYRSWPVNIQPPGEGSLDLEQFLWLCEILAGTPAAQEGVLAYYALLGNTGWKQDTLRAGTIDDVVLLYADESVFGSPTNLWPCDRSWLVYTDWDLWGTKVSGSAELIDRLRRDERLDTVNLPD
jgi:hypothetical protein